MKEFKQVLKGYLRSNGVDPIFLSNDRIVEYVIEVMRDDVGKIAILTTNDTIIVEVVGYSIHEYATEHDAPYNTATMIKLLAKIIEKLQD